MPKKPWFKTWGWIYQPVSFAGWLLTIVLVLFLVHIFWAVDHHVNSVSDVFYGIFPYWVPAILVWLWVGSKTNSG